MVVWTFSGLPALRASSRPAPLSARCLLEPAVELVRTLELSLIRSLALTKLGLTYVYRRAV